MLARTKEPHTEMTVLSFLVPIASALQAKAYVEEQLGGQEIPEAASIPWRQAFPEWKEETAPGVYLAGARYREGLTQVQLAKMTGIPQRHLSEMERGKRPIGKDRAKKLAEALHINYRVLL
jgi:hypothetical protein